MSKGNTGALDIEPFVRRSTRRVPRRGGALTRRVPHPLITLPLSARPGSTSTCVIYSGELAEIAWAIYMPR